MFLPFLPAVAAQSPLLLNDASVGRREYAVELHIESENGDSITESSLIAERHVRQFMGFQRTRYVIGSVNDGGTPSYKAGTHDRDLLSPNGIGQKGARDRVPLMDPSFPDGPLTPGTEWSSNAFDNIPLLCRYVGDEEVAGRTAARITFRVDEKEKGLTFEEAYTLIDRTDARPLQTYVRARLEFFGRTRVLYRLRRTNVPGLSLPR